MRINLLSGKRFGKQVVLEQVGSNISSKVLWKVRCDCGNERIVVGSKLTTKCSPTQACKACSAKMAGKNYPVHRKMKHGLTVKGKKKHYLFSVWDNIKQRCNNPKHPAYKNYGGRGIVLFQEWHDFLVFKDYIIGKLGSRPFNYSIDRIDNDGNYEPNNIFWSPRSCQQRNRRNTYSVSGTSKTGEVKYYKNMCDVEIDGFDATCVSKCVNGKHKTHKGFSWLKA